MTTQWDDDRLRAEVEAWEPRSGAQVKLGQSSGYVVRVYDRGPATGRSEPGTLTYDSEATHGSAGVFGDDAAAAVYATRIHEAITTRERWREQVQHERREGLDAAQGIRFRVYDAAKAEAKEANARAKEAQDEIRRLRDEASDPSILLDCPFYGEGFRVVLAPSLTDGTVDEQEGRTLTSTLEEPKPVSASRRRSSTPAPRKKPAANEAPKVEAKLPQHVPDASGKPLRVGSRVEAPGHNVDGEVTKIVRQDPDGAYVVEIEDDSGIPLELASTELVKISKGGPADDGWPE